MSKETVTTPASAIKDMVEGSGRIKRPRPEPGTQARTDRNGNAVDVSTDIPDTLAPMGNVRGQIALNEASMREIIGAPIEADEVSVRTSHNAPDPDGEAPDLAAIPYVEGEATEPGTPVPVDQNRKTDARPSIAGSTKTGVGTTSTAPPANTTSTEDSESSAQTASVSPVTSTVSTEPSETTVPTPQTAVDEQDTDNGDTRNNRDTAPIVPALDADSARRSVKQRKSDLDEYRQRYMKIPRIADRKPVFVSHTTRDRLDRIVRLLGERGMSVSGLIENIALRHLETHEPDVEHWRKM